MGGFAILAVTGVAAYYDVRWRRVPNWLAGGFAAGALAGHSATGGWSGLLASAGGLAIALVLLFPLFVVRGLGAGDVKFAAAVGAALTYTLLPRMLLLTFLVAGTIAVADVICQRRAIRTMSNLLHAYRGLPGIHEPGTLLVPFTLASAVATWWVLLGPRG